MHFPEWTYDYTLISALLLTAVHWFGPSLRRNMHRHGNIIRSLGGGIAVAYVFLGLFPDLEGAEAWLGHNIHLVTLVSFLFFYLLEGRLISEPVATRVSGINIAPTGEAANAILNPSRQQESPSSRGFWWHIGLVWIYTWMVIFASRQESGDGMVIALIATIAIGLHLIYKEYIFRLNYPPDLAARGRLLLASAPIIGFIAHDILQPPDVVFNLFIASLAGILMQGIFRDELPSQQDAYVRWLVGGALIFTLLTILT